MIERVHMSKTGHARLREELTRLERKERIEVIKSIEIARGHGDLKENAEYHAAKERQGHVEGRIMELKDKLGRAEVIDCSNVNCSRVVFGAEVTIVDLETDEEVTYQLLGQEESDVKNGTISIFSPWGKAMIGKSIGDEIAVKTPSGVRQLEIVDIQQGSTP
ncbi:MAG: transcription elongation factor GreA [Desulfobulbaceae bacterium]|uniref:Transcription elongation factor GreA n=1 Tax=Candidatus Desulfobia pelagia TaxID=2841692 RepID=A0A8J6NBZ4_9BACT|nr:transcription elongation factor GreA [Candidatus Desulfobia pelagia]